MWPPPSKQAKERALRIGLDMLGIQAGEGPTAAYARQLAAVMVQGDSRHEFVLYGHDEHPRDAIPAGPRARFVPTGFGAPPGETTPAARLQALAEANPDRLDVFMVLDPFAPALAFGPPARPLSGLRMAALVPDVTAFLVPERDLADPVAAAQGYRALARLGQYDAILTPSLTTQDDVRKLLGLPAARVHAIGHAADGRWFAPEDSLPMPLEARRVLHDLGIRRAYLVVEAGFPGQQNALRMIGAYRMLPERLRRAYQLVVTGAVPADQIEEAQAAADPEWRASIAFTGALGASARRALLQHAAVYIHPALHAGFGQPILEAMLCGAAIVAGNNAAQAELAGDAGRLADPSDSAAIVAQVQRLLDDWTLNRALRRRAAAQARLLTFERAAARALEVLEHAMPARGTPRRLRVDRAQGTRTGRSARPRIAFFSPLPPRISGIADYAARLLEELKATYTIDLYHDAGYLPDLGLGGHGHGHTHGFATYDGRVFARNCAVLNYHAVVYQMGNAIAYHGYLYDVLMRHPGVVTLHDFFLSVYPYRGARTGAEILAAFGREIRHFCPDRAAEFLPHLAEWCEEEGGLSAACARRSLYLNRRVFESALGVAVHSPWCLEQVRLWMPEHVAKTVVIPLGTVPRECTERERAAIRDRFGIPQEALVVASIGFVHPDKLVNEALGAFRAVAEADPSACFLCVGQECDGGAARRQAEALGLTRRVRFLGRRPAADYADLIAVTDIGVSLRRPPTNGETSAALLDLLAAGVAAIVTDVATFGDYPDTVVRKVRWDARGPEALGQALRTLARDPMARRALGRAALEHVRQNHAWPRAAARYVELIERCARRRGAAPAEDRSWARC
jgi:glycosyltransferase involved in cell wall biosynthesis